MTYEQILHSLSTFNLFAWVLASIACFVAQRYMRSSGWTLMALGSIFVVIRMSWGFIPGYKQAQSSDAFLNLYMAKFLMGGIGAIVLGIGLFMLIVDYFVVQRQLKQ